MNPEDQDNSDLVIRLDGISTFYNDETGCQPSLADDSHIVEIINHNMAGSRTQKHQ